MKSWEITKKSHEPHTRGSAITRPISLPAERGFHQLLIYPYFNVHGTGSPALAVLSTMLV